MTKAMAGDVWVSASGDVLEWVRVAAVGEPIVAGDMVLNGHACIAGERPPAMAGTRKENGGFAFGIPAPEIAVYRRGGRIQ